LELEEVRGQQQSLQEKLEIAETNWRDAVAAEEVERKTRELAAMQQQATRLAVANHPLEEFTRAAVTEIKNLRVTITKKDQYIARIEQQAVLGGLDSMFGHGSKAAPGQLSADWLSLR
jgi:phage shock protein A